MDEEMDQTPYMTEDYDFRNEEAAAEQMEYEASMGLE